MINQARYRHDYDGEFVIVETKWSGGKKEQKREWVPNPIENQHISGRATCILSAIDQFRYDYRKLESHRGGLLGSKKLQNYSTGHTARDMRLDFTVEIDSAELAEIINRKYQEKNIVYTTTRQCLIHPGEFYLIPYNPNMCIEALVVYLAAFDGHKEVFIIGANTDMTASNNTWADQVGRVIDLYRSTNFIAVGNSATVPESWYNLPNFKTMEYREFLSYCDC